MTNYTITQTWNAFIPAWEPSKLAYYEDNIPNQYTCEYACNANYTRVGAMNINLGQVSIGSLNFRPTMDSKGNSWIAYVGEGNTMQVQKISSTGMVINNRTRLSDYTLTAGASLGLWLDSSDKPYIYY